MNCLYFQLLDDGSGRDPLETYNFGKAANYLFRPCMNEDGTPDEVSKSKFSSIKLIRIFTALVHDILYFSNRSAILVICRVIQSRKQMKKS